jgi:glycine cleavage system H protein
MIAAIAKPFSGVTCRHCTKPIRVPELQAVLADLFAPVNGTIVQFNSELLKDPSPINLDSYGEGWLFEMRGDGKATLAPIEYYQFLEANWEKTQRTLKGHM